MWRFRGGMDNKAGSKEPLLSKAEEQIKTKVYFTRWWILFWFSCLSCFQCLFWITFSSVARTTRDFFGVSDGLVNFWLNLATIIYLLIGLQTVWVSEKMGLRITVLVGLAGVAGCAWLRLLPLLNPKARWAHYVITLAQLMNGAAGPVVMNLVSKVSSVWFPHKERTIATATAVLANSCGAALGFLIGPFMIDHFNLQALLYLEAALIFPCALAIVLYFPDAPPHPPSVSTALQAEESDENKPAVSLKDIKSLVTNVPLLILAVAGGGVQGAYNGWTGMWEQLLEPHFSQTEAGWFAFASTMCLIVGSVIAGYLGDTWLKGHFKAATVLCMFASCLCMAWFTLSLPARPFWNEPILPRNVGTVGASGSLVGLTLGILNPIVYELGAEVSYPLSETYSATFIAMLNNLICCICLFIGSRSWFSFFFFAMMIFFAIVIPFVPVKYRRSIAEKERKNVEYVVTDDALGRGSGAVLPDTDIAS